MTRPGYMSGFGNEFATEAVPGTLPEGQNNPQRCPHGLYAEQLSGTAFTAPAPSNRRSWLYRIRPSAEHPSFEPFPGSEWEASWASEHAPNPNRQRWSPMPEPDPETDFIDGMRVYCTAGVSAPVSGCAVLLYAANRSMKDRYFMNADGEWLVVPQEGRLQIKTELGVLEIGPGDIGVIPRGMKFQVVLRDKTARGYICENYGAPLRIPDRGVIGANGLANPRDFLTPQASFEERSGTFVLDQKYHNRLWRTELAHSPLDVVGWHGNLAPYQYNLDTFSPVNAVRVDHPDPSIFTVLTSPGVEPGVANVDFVIFPERWMVAENTFRPPWFHRNVMSEFMGLVVGEYDAKGADGFIPGGGSLHPCMSGHGPDAKTAQAATEVDLQPHRYENTLAFMFETRFAMTPTDYGLNCPQRQQNYDACWADMSAPFRVPQTDS